MRVLRLLIILILLAYAKCAKILGVFPAPGYSQFILAEKLMLELANREHEVTVISAYRPKNEPQNYKTIFVNETIEKCEDMNLFDLEDGNLFENIKSTYQLGFIITETVLANSAIQKLLRSDERFDLVIVEQFFIEALTGFSGHFGAPLVFFSSIGPSEWNNHLMGNPAIPSISTVAWTPYTRYMDFYQRSVNLVATIYDFGYKHLVAFPQHNKYLKKYFPRPLELNDLIYNASLMLLNSHVTTSENAPLLYGMVEIGGFHITPKKLSQNIQHILDKAEKGAILFALGTNLRSSDLSQNTIDGILRAFSRLNQTILWKFERDLPNKPKNVFISRWLRQSDILAHPNVQLFITHGGLLSVTEAIFYGVPMVGIPIFGDQKMNIARMVRNNLAQTIPFRQLSEEALFFAINETINNPKYQDNIRKMSNIMRDNIIRPLDLAMYWIEYVLRNGGNHFRAPALYLYWFQVYLLDILSAFVFALIVIYFITKKTLMFAVNREKHIETGYKKNNVNKNKKHKKQ